MNNKCRFQGSIQVQLNQNNQRGNGADVSNYVRFHVQKPLPSLALVAHITVTLATWEAEIGRAWFNASPGNKFARPCINQ
jgi:hypothetical protein